MFGQMSCSHRLAAALGVCLAVAGIPALGAEHAFDGVYSGERVLTKGSGPDCPAEDNVSVNIHGEVLSFSNSVLQNFGIGFYPQQDGSFHPTYTDDGGDIVNIIGHINLDVMAADVTNPPCEHHWHLKKE
jgi:hypothetical protein